MMMILLIAYCTEAKTVDDEITEIEAPENPAILPCIVAVACAAVCAGLLALWVPPHAEAFKALRVDLPLPTVAVLSVSRTGPLVACGLLFGAAVCFALQYALRWLGWFLVLAALLSIAFSVAAIKQPLKKIRETLQKNNPTFEPSQPTL